MQHLNRDISSAFDLWTFMIYIFMCQHFKIISGEILQMWQQSKETSPSHSQPITAASRHDIMSVRIDVQKVYRDIGGPSSGSHTRVLHVLNHQVITCTCFRGVLVAPTRTAAPIKT